MVIFSQCMDCNNYIDRNKDGKHYCKAFPNGISDDILWNRIKHDNSIDGDNGIKFENIKKS